VCKLTFLAFPFFSPSSLAMIFASSVSSACTLAIRSAVLSVELSDESVLRRVFAWRGEWWFGCGGL
jgi:hypothetical protein